MCGFVDAFWCRDFVFNWALALAQHVDGYPTTVLFNGEEEEGEKRRFENGNQYDGPRTAVK